MVKNDPSHTVVALARDQPGANQKGPRRAPVAVPDPAPNLNGAVASTPHFARAVFQPVSMPLPLGIARQHDRDAVQIAGRGSAGDRLAADLLDERQIAMHAAAGKVRLGHDPRRIRIGPAHGQLVVGLLVAPGVDRGPLVEPLGQDQDVFHTLTAKLHRRVQAGGPAADHQRVDADAGQGSCVEWARIGAEAGHEGPPVIALEGARLRRDLARLAEGHELVVIDGPPRLDAEARAALLVATALPLLAPSCSGYQPGLKLFAKGSLIIPMDVCYQYQTDQVRGSYTPTACPGAVDNGDVIKAYGLVYQLIRNGVAVYWIINPDNECVEVCHAPDKRRLIGSGADLDGEHLLPGFRYPIADLFKGWDWE